ncbi:MAG: SCP2 sterol-binding domain-containing protein [Candidatus Hodarchaeales archaeon]
MTDLDVVQSIKTMLERFTAEKNQKRFRKWNKTMAFTMSDLDKTWKIIITEGIPGEPVEEKPESADIWITTDSATWAGIMNGEESGMKAYTKGKLKVKGKMPDLLKLQKLM